MGFESKSSKISLPSNVFLL